MKLDLGAGGNRVAQDYLTVDRYTPADIVGDLWDVPVPNGSVTELYSSHALEHVPIAKVQPTLIEWYRIMAPGASGCLKVPNMDYAAQYWLTGVDRVWAEYLIFGHQAHDGEYHKTAFTPSTLKQKLELVGFSVKDVSVVWDYNQETICARFVKPEVARQRNLPGISPT